MDKRPIGVFDSGLGGLTVVKELKNILPDEQIIYFGDTGRVPYGTRSRETIRRYTAQDIRLLQSFDVKMIIAACGTVSANVLEKEIEDLKVPYTGVLLPAVQSACAVSTNGIIGVIGTTATVRSGAYGKAIRGIRPDAKVIGHDCPLFVPLVENGMIERGNQITELTAQMYLTPFLTEDIDTLIMGCTHYPLLYDFISDVFGNQVTLIDPGKETAHYVQNYLTSNNMLFAGDDPQPNRYFVSDTVDGFCETAEKFLQRDLNGQVERIMIEDY